MALRFSVFGDVHGRVPLMLLLTRAWQEAHDVALDGILQVGDMGAFPDHTRLDKATARHAQEDPDELDFVHFLSATPLARALLEHADTPPITFCRGNHEDFQFLGRYRVPTALDPFQKLWFVPDGQVMHLRANGRDLRVGAFGGAPPVDRPGAGPPSRTRLPTPKFHPDDAASAFTNGEPLDILLTHGGPLHDAFPSGCPHLATLTERVRPQVHLFGHHHEVVGPVTTRGVTLVGLDHLDFLRDNSLRPNSWGILELDGDEVQFTWMNQPDHRWLSPFRRRRYRDFIHL